MPNFKQTEREVGLNEKNLSKSRGQIGRVEGF